MTRSVLSAALVCTALCTLALRAAAAQPGTPSAPAVAAAPQSYAGLPLRAQVAAITAEPPVSRAHWGVSVTRLDGTPVFAMNDAQFFQPASNAKLFTTAAAMALLGLDRTFVTTVYTQAKVKSPAIVDGDLFLHGGGDANLSGTDLPYLAPGLRPKVDPTQPKPDPLRYLAELADKLAATGLKRVTGNIIGDDSLFVYEPYPEDWTMDDAVWGYGAPVSALTINDNQIALTMQPGSKAGQAITYDLSPAMPWYTIDTSDAKTSPAKTGSHLNAERIAGGRVLRIYGTIAVDAPPDAEEIAIDDPAEYAAKAFKMLLSARGITVAGEVGVQHRPAPAPVAFTSEARRPLTIYEDGVVVEKRAHFVVEEPLVSRTSVPLGVDVVLTNKISQNLHAELLLHQLSVAFADGSTVGGARVVRSWLTQRVKVDPDDFILFDGSGLSGHDLVTPRAITTLLGYTAKQPWGAAWKASLPVGGEDGSLRARFPDAPMKDHVFAKTGTLSEARALSGFVDCASGQTLLFSVMVNAHTPRTVDDQKAMDRIVAAIAATN